MLHEIYLWLSNQLLTNQFSAGAVTATVLGSSVYLLRSIPEQIKNLTCLMFSKHALIKSTDNIFESLVSALYTRSPNSSKVQMDYSTPKIGYGWGYCIYNGTLILYNFRLTENGSGSLYREREYLNMYFILTSNEVMLKILVELSVPDNSVININGYSKYDGWSVTSVRTKRKVSTVILEKILKDEILHDIETFFSNGTKYKSKNIVHKRGYLLYGPPGTGKTSIILAIGSQFNLPIYFVDLNGLTDSDLYKAFANIPINSIIVMEDIDVTISCITDITKTDNANIITLSGLLNVLDGLNSVEGSILFITTNNVESIHPVILRNGRIDKRYSFDYFDETLADEMITLYTTDINEVNDIKRDITYPIAPCLLQEKLLPYI
jgi:chaperone BCS1